MQKIPTKQELKTLVMNAWLECNRRALNAQSEDIKQYNEIKALVYCKVFDAFNGNTDGLKCDT